MDELGTVDTPTPVNVEPEGDGEDERGIWVEATIARDGVLRSTRAYFQEMPEESVLAGELFNVITAVASMAGPGVRMELLRRFAALG